MRYIAFGLLLGLAFVISFSSGPASAALPNSTAGNHAGGLSSGGQNFGRTGGTAPINSSPLPGTGTLNSSPISTSPSTLTGPTGGTFGAIPAPSTIGTGSFNNTPSPYPMTQTQGGGIAPNASATSPSQASNSSQSGANQSDTSNPFSTTPSPTNTATTNTAGGSTTTTAVPPSAGNTATNASTSTPNNSTAQSNSSASGAMRDIHLYQGRWWHSMPGGHWVYWEPTHSSWVFLATNESNVANSATPSTQYQSGYRGLENTAPSANANTSANSSSNANAATGTGEIPASQARGWYWHEGQWQWFDGRVFRPAR